MTVKAKALQKGLFCLLAAVLAFLLCSLLAAATGLHAAAGAVALAMHIVGLALCFAGIGWAIRELALSISPLEEEAAFLDALAAHAIARAEGNRPERRSRAA